MRDKKKIIGSIIILLLFFTFLILGYFMSKPKVFKNNENDIFVDSTNIENANIKKNSTAFTVEIKGAVNKPGVYTMKSGDIINDLVEKAGGFREDANIDSLNRAKKLKDEDCIYIFKKGEETNLTVLLNSSISNSSGAETKININTASKEELDKLPGVGEATAQKIIDYREKNGGFKTIEDLKKVSGIGESKFNNLKEQVDIR